KVIKKTGKKNIDKFFYLKQKTAYEMKSVVIKATDKTKGIDLNILRRAALDYYRYEKEAQPTKVNAETVEKVESKDEGKEDYFSQLDKISPVTRIRQLRNNNPSRNDEILVTRLVTETSLNNGVINILL